MLPEWINASKKLQQIQKHLCKKPALLNRFSAHQVCYRHCPGNRKGSSEVFRRTCGVSGKHEEVMEPCWGPNWAVLCSLPGQLCSRKWSGSSGLDSGHKEGNWIRELFFPGPAASKSTETLRAILASHPLNTGQNNYRCRWITKLALRYSIKYCLLSVFDRILWWR